MNYDPNELFYIQRTDRETYNKIIAAQEQDARDMFSEIGEIIEFSSKSSDSIGQYWAYGNQYDITVKLAKTEPSLIYYHFATAICGKTRICYIIYFKRNMLPLSDKDQAVIISVVNSIHFEED